MTDHPGLLIALEGIDNVGKTTQAQRLADWLRSHNRSVIISRELRTGIGQCFRAEFEARKLSPRIKALLFAADRYYRLETEILPALEQGVVVLVDRWVQSALVYRGVEGQGEDLAKLVNQDTATPDITFLIDIEADLAYDRGRMANKQSPYSTDFLTVARKHYLEIAGQQGLIVVDGAQSIEQVTGSLIEHLMPLLGERK